MVNENITLEGARIIFRNFSGKEGKFNPEGRRNFCVLLDSKFADILARDGWNIRWLQPRDDDEEPQAYMQVAVAFGKIPPKIVIISGNGKHVLGEEDVNVLDWAEIKNVDMVIRPYNWEASGKTGVKAYVKSLYVTINEDDLEKKYRDVPDSAQNAMANRDD